MFSIKKLYLIFILYCIISWNKQPGSFQKTANELCYKQIEIGKGKPKQADSIFIIDLIIKTKNKEIIYSTIEQNVPYVLSNQNQQHKKESHLEEVFSLLHKEGDRFMIQIATKSLLKEDQIFMNGALQELIQKYDTLWVEIHLKQIKTPQEYEEWKKEQLDAYLKNQAQQLQKENERIDAYIAKYKLDCFKTSSAIRYVIMHKGIGEQVTPKSILKFYYTIRLLNGKVIGTNSFEEAHKHKIYDPNKIYIPTEVYLKQNDIIAPLKESLLYLRKGTKVKLFIPSLFIGNTEQYFFLAKKESMVLDIEVIYVCN